MSRSKKQKKSKQQREKELELKRLNLGLANGTIIRVDPERIKSHSTLLPIPEFYRDKKFHCKDCGVKKVWSAKRQKWWYEIIGGDIESTAIRCRECRQLERERKTEARRTYYEGLERKRLRLHKPKEE